MNDDVNTAKARSHLSIVALGLASKLGPDTAAAVLVGAAVGILTMSAGPEQAVEFFRAIADSIENGDDESVSPAGHA